jgi:hypothetical protein
MAPLRLTLVWQQQARLQPHPLTSPLGSKPPTLTTSTCLPPLQMSAGSAQPRVKNIPSQHTPQHNTTQHNSSSAPAKTSSSHNPPPSTYVLSVITQCVALFHIPGICVNTCRHAPLQAYQMHADQLMCALTIRSHTSIVVTVVTAMTVTTARR